LAAGYVAIIAKAEAVRELLKDFQKSVWGPLTFGLALVALMIIAYRRQHQELIDELGAVVKREYARLEEKFKKGEWEELAPTAEMSSVVDRLARLEALKGVLLKEKTSPQQRDALKKLEAAIPHMQQRLVELDLLRRMDLGLPPTEEHSAGARRWWPRVRTVLTSRTFAADTTFVGKMSSRVATAALFVCLLGVSSALVADAVQDVSDQANLSSSDHRQ